MENASHTRPKEKSKGDVPAPGTTHQGMGVTEKSGQGGGRRADSQTYKNKGNSNTEIKVPNTAE
ncbi:unnamed protein product [Ectocarpus sp. CCAP 1310/34]|nr:unnamed protein product [Ectocarpus sp. CCAP 1310/34]